jgi:predicted aconitase with swiveling domain
MISLEDELPASAGAAPPRWRGSTSASTWRSARAARAGRPPVVLIFDQFEEVLTVAALAVDAKRAFFTAVGQALEAGSTGRCS